MSSPYATPRGAPRIIVCDYNRLSESVIEMLRVSGYAVFPAQDREAAVELCEVLPDVCLLVLNTQGTRTDLPALVHSVREVIPGLAVLHIGRTRIPGMPSDVLTLPETFGPERLLGTVRTVLARAG